MVRALIEPLEPADKQLEGEWRRLEALARPTFFLCWDWVGTLVATPSPENKLSLLRLREGSETVGLALMGQERAVRHLLVRSDRLHLNSPGDALTIEDNLLLARPDLEPACWDAILNWFAHEQTLADELVLQGLRRPLDLVGVSGYGLWYDSIPLPSYHVEFNRLGAAGRLTDILSKNARYQLRRSIRDYGGPNGLELREAASIEEALDWFENLKALHVASWTRREKRHAFSRPFFERFHRNLIRRTFAAGRIQMLRIRAGTGPIGYLYNFRDGERIYAYQSGFADQDRRLRPGTVSHALAIEHNFRLGIQVYDFMAGSNQLKRSFATGCRDMHWTTLQLARLRFRLERAARHAKRGFARAFQ